MPAGCRAYLTRKSCEAQAGMRCVVTVGVGSHEDSQGRRDTNSRADQGRAGRRRTAGLDGGMPGRDRDRHRHCWARFHVDHRGRRHCARDRRGGSASDHRGRPAGPRARVGQALLGADAARSRPAMRPTLWRQSMSPCGTSGQALNQPVWRAGRRPGQECRSMSPSGSTFSTAGSYCRGRQALVNRGFSA